jgi:hypothetical protein
LHNLQSRLDHGKRRHDAAVLPSVEERKKRLYVLAFKLAPAMRPLVVDAQGTTCRGLSPRGMLRKNHELDDWVSGLRPARWPGCPALVLLADVFSVRSDSGAAPSVR